MNNIANLKFTALALSVSVVIAGCGGSDGSADTTPPVLTLNGDSVVTVAHGGSYSDAGVEITDNVDTALSFTTTGSVDTSQAGTYTIIYNAEDSAGNQASPITREIVVGYDFPLPGVFYQYDIGRGVGLVNGNFETIYTHFFAEVALDANQLDYDLGILENGSIDYSIVESPSLEFINGVWVSRSKEDPLEVVLSEQNTIITANNGANKITITDVEDVSGMNIADAILDGYSFSNDSVYEEEAVMSGGSLLYRVRTEQLSDAYTLGYEFYSYNYTPSAEDDAVFYLDDERTYGSLSEFVEAECVDLGGVVSTLNTEERSIDIAFTCGQSDQSSGTLTGHYQNSSGLTELEPNLGTWEIITLPGSSTQALVATINPEFLDEDAYQLTEHQIFVVNDGVVWAGYKVDTGTVTEQTFLNEASVDSIISAAIELTRDDITF